MDGQARYSVHHWSWLKDNSTSHYLSTKQQAAHIHLKGINSRILLALEELWQAAEA